MAEVAEEVGRVEEVASVAEVVVGGRADRSRPRAVLLEVQDHINSLKNFRVS